MTRTLYNSVCDHLPPHVQEVLSLMSATPPPAVLERRRQPRAAYQVRAMLEPLDVIDGDSEHAAHVVYTRDANESGVGFITDRPEAVGREAVLSLASPAAEGVALNVRGIILRSREVADGWYEGALLFAHRCGALSPEHIENARDRNRDRRG